MTLLTEATHPLVDPSHTDALGLSYFSGSKPFIDNASGQQGSTMRSETVSTERSQLGFGRLGHQPVRQAVNHLPVSAGGVAEGKASPPPRPGPPPGIGGSSLRQQLSPRPVAVDPGLLAQQGALADIAPDAVGAGRPGHHHFHAFHQRHPVSVLGLGFALSRRAFYPFAPGSGLRRICANVLGLVR